LHSARATNAAAYYLYLNVTRLLERWRTEEERIERDRAGVPRLHAPTHSPTSDLWSVNHWNAAAWYHWFYGVSAHQGGSVMVVRIGTWNLENLFKPPSEYGPKTDAEYDAKLAALASAITRMDPHVRAVQEVGDPAALQALADRVGGTWHIETADPEAGTNHTIRVGMLSRVVLTQPKQISAFPDKLRAIQQGRRTRRRHQDDGQTRSPCSCPPRRRRHRIITAHFKSKLLTFPGGRFSPHDEAERGRFAAYALYRRSAEATTVRAAATDRLTGQP
jgi:hypothetical protein